MMWSGSNALHIYEAYYIFKLSVPYLQETSDFR